MLFNNLMNKELQSFSRNLAVQFFIGSLGLLGLYRADTVISLTAYQSILIYILGVLLFIWSIYLAYTNVLILCNDYREYLLRKFDILQSNKPTNLPRIQIKTENLLEISLKINESNGFRLADILKTRFEGIFIFFILSVSSVISFLGIVILFVQQTRILN